MAGHVARLIVLAPSHYCERARWVLDHRGIAYVEERWAVGPHVPLARRMAGGTSLPILRTDTAVMQGSGRILDWAGVPGGDPDLEARFEGRIGGLVRQFLYAGTLGTPVAARVRDLLLEGVAPWQAVAGWLAWPAIRRLMVTSLDARPERLPSLTQAIEAELDWFEARLDGRPHLVGEAFGRADLTAASLLAPLAGPPERATRRSVPWPPIVADALARWRARPALRWVLATYATHRGTVGRMRAAASAR